MSGGVREYGDLYPTYEGRGDLIKIRIKVRDNTKEYNNVVRSPREI
jgi:hypothetical protein